MTKGKHVYPGNHRSKDNSEEDFRQKYIKSLTVETRALGLLYKFGMVVGSFLCVANHPWIVSEHPGPDPTRCETPYSL